MMNLLATIVASYGLIQNSTAVVIGAMIIAMLLGPINGLALAFNDGNIKLLRRAGSAEAVGVIIVLVTSMVIGKIHQDIPATNEILSRTAPNILDLLIALAGGAAGAYALVSPKLQSSVVGVAIATALVPPLCTAGILFAKGDMRLAMGGFLLFFTNLVTIQAAASAVFWVYGLHARVIGENSTLVMLKRNWMTFALMGALSIFLYYTFNRSIHNSTIHRLVTDELRAVLTDTNPGINLVDAKVSELSDKLDVYCVIQTPVGFSPELVQETEAKVGKIEGKPLNLTIRSVITKESNGQNWLHQGGDTENTAKPPEPESNIRVKTDLTPKIPVKNGPKIDSNFIGPPPPPKQVEDDGTGDEIASSLPTID